MPGALEYFFASPFTLSEYDFLNFLNYDRSYRLMLENQHKLTGFYEDDGLITLNVTIFERIKELAVAKKLCQELNNLGDCNVPI